MTGVQTCALPISLGYARDFPPLIARIAGAIRERGVRVIANFIKQAGHSPRGASAASGAWQFWQSLRVSIFLPPY